MKKLTLALIATLALAGCSSSQVPAAAPPARTTTTTHGPSASPIGDPQTYDGAKAAVDRLTAAIAAHDGGTAWDMLTSAGQAAISRADYVKVVRQCPRLFTSEQTLSIALNTSATIATITATAPADQGGGTITWTMIYERGHWKHQPSDAALKWMSYGADKALSVLRSSGNC